MKRGNSARVRVEALISFAHEHPEKISVKEAIDLATRLEHNPLNVFLRNKINNIAKKFNLDNYMKTESW
jgi:ABC-type multidrug transport system ATPase subunit